ncbi:MAG: phosphate regulon transcriptional regulator PhoB [Candidatus Thiodiazotropha sp. (ex Notomyrtea botanica)]|nr:phosphate regulon transcriptional regulator PhoB [Candidatus Thiodiazotropha sp. (ex Notomyrtea botanica)]
MKRILIVEDEPEIREMIRFTLEPRGFVVSETDNAQDARRLLAEHAYDLILMDWMLPGRSGLDFTKEIKQKKQKSSPPIIMLTARADESDKVEGLDSGADDYITKPFSPRELAARIKAVIRRSSDIEQVLSLEFNGLYLDPVQHLVTLQGDPTNLSPAEYNLLYFFMSHPDRAYTRSQILDKVWGDNAYVEERTVDVHIRRLRKILAPSGHDAYIQTVRGVGYRFTPTKQKHVQVTS